MQNNFKTAYEGAVKQADEMMNSFNIILNAGIKQKLTQSLHSVKEQINVSEKVASRVLNRVEYEAEMVRRVEALNQAITLVNVAAKKNVLIARLENLQSGINQLNGVLSAVTRQPQNQLRNNRGNGRGIASNTR